MNINFCHSCFKLSSCETSRGCLHSFGIYLSGHVLVSFCLVIMDDRSRLESHLKSLNKLQALSKVRRVLRGKFGLMQLQQEHTSKIVVKSHKSQLSRIFWGQKLTWRLVEPIYLGIQATYYFLLVTW